MHDRPLVGREMWAVHGICTCIAIITTAFSMTQVFFGVVLAVMWIPYLFTTSVVLTLGSLIPLARLRNPVAQMGVWALGLALAAPLMLLFETALVPLSGPITDGFPFGEYLWSAPLFGVYLVVTTIAYLRRTKTDANRSVTSDASPHPER